PAAQATPAQAPWAHAAWGRCAGHTYRTSHRASAPLPISPTKATTARRELTRRTLLKPGFPEPTLRMSTPEPVTDTTAKGNEPIAKQIRNRTRSGAEVSNIGLCMVNYE